MKALIHAAGPYTVDNVFVESTSVYTNKTYAGACRGFGVPQVSFASESQVDEVAKKVGMDRLELRIKNGLKAGDANATGQVYEQSVGLRETQEKIRVLPPLKKQNTERYLYGTGYSSILQGISNGAEGIDVVGGAVQVSQDGSVLVSIGLTELGQGSRTVYALIASEVLGVSLENITVRLVDTDGVHNSGPTVASRSTTVGGMAIKKAAEQVKDSLLSMAALMFEMEKEAIILKDDCAVLRDNDQARIPLREVATAAFWTGYPLMNLTFSKAPESSYDHDTHQGDIYIAYNYGTHRMDVQVDTYTGDVKVLRHVAAHDVGKVINPLGLEGQVEGASLMGLGFAHLEEVLYTNGIVQNPNFADYAVPSVKDRLPTETISVEDYNPTGPYGAKGIGEPPLAAAAAAFANGITDATGIQFRRLPITKEDIIAGLQGGYDD
jgi:CO/xanthine dehydrogenase Mo-binding subunit